MVVIGDVEQVLIEHGERVRWAMCKIRNIIFSLKVISK